MPLIVESVTEADLPIAVRMLFSRAAFPVLASRRFLQLLAEAEFDVRGILVAKQGTTVCGAMFAYCHGGAQAAVWLPVAEERAVRDALVAGTLAWLQSTGVKVVQAVLRTDELPLTELLERAGFRHITRLRFLTRELSPQDSEQKLQGLTSRAVARPTDEFAELLHRTYEGSLDIPELDGQRTGEEILAGYAATLPLRWWQFDDATGTVGALILSPPDEANAIELTYLGVVPEARGRGYGRRILDFALAETVGANGQVVNLSVDVRNEPAVRLYRVANFREYDLREVFLHTIPYSIAK